jgi:hypothetical protein
MKGVDAADAAGDAMDDDAEDEAGADPDMVRDKESATPSVPAS